MYNLTKKGDSNFPILKTSMPNLEENDVFLQQILSQFDSEGLIEELKKKSINLRIEKTGATATAFDLIFVVKDVLLPTFIAVFSPFIYGLLKSKGNKNTNYAILIKTEIKEIQFYGDRTIETCREELFLFKK